MATLRILAIAGATKVYLTSIGTTTGTPTVGGYTLTNVIGKLHTATITGLTGPFYAICKDGSGTVMGEVPRVVMVDAAVTIDTTDSREEFKADPQLGTADGGLVAEVNKIQRSATAVTPGAPQEKQLVDGAGNTLQTVHEKILGDA